MTQFTPYASSIGGLLIGLSAVLLMASNGRIAGMTGVLNGVIPPLAKDWQWRAAFLAGAIAGPLAWSVAGGSPISIDIPVSTTAMVVGGLIVGVGVTFGSGCTSGHGVCGLARFSKRSLVATCVFMASTFATVFVIRHLISQ